MVYKVIFKKRCRNKLEKLLIYIENELGLLVAQKFAVQFQKKINMLQQHPFVGKQCMNLFKLLFFYRKVLSERAIAKPSMFR